MKKTVHYQRIRIDIGSDYLDFDEKGNEFTSVFQAISKAYQISKDQKITVKVILDSTLDNDEYKIQNIAVINANVLDETKNAYYKPEFTSIRI